MTTVTTVTSPVNPTTYLKSMQDAFEHNTSSLKPLVTELSRRINTPMATLSVQVQEFILKNQLDQLRPYLTAGCELYEGIGKGHAAAKQALEKFQNTLASIPEKIVLPVEVIKHMEGLDVMTAYNEKEATCMTARKALQEIVTKLAGLVKDSGAFMENMKGPLNTVAYEVKRIENKTGLMDRLPSRGYYYFDEALVAYKNPVKPAESTTASATTTHDKELVELKTAQAGTPKRKNSAADLAASLS